MTLLDIKKLDKGIGFDLIEENIQISPELEVIPADTIRGTEMTLTVRTDLPSAAFRNFNEGVARTKSGFKDKVFQTCILDSQVAVDTQLVKNAMDPIRPLEADMSGRIEAAMRHIAAQMWYGITNDAKGFPGLIAQMPSAATHYVDVTGTTTQSSVYFLRLGRNSLSFLFGNGTTINMNPEWMIETVYDSSSNPYQAYTNWLTGAVGFRLANKNAVVRIKNIQAATKTLTDAHMFSAHQKFIKNYGMPPNAIFMNSRSQEQLRASRTATNPTGVPVPIPRDWQGIPIHISEAISEAETI